MASTKVNCIRGIRGKQFTNRSPKHTGPSDRADKILDRKNHKTSRVPAHRMEHADSQNPLKVPLLPFLPPQFIQKHPPQNPLKVPLFSCPKEFIPTVWGI